MLHCGASPIPVNPRVYGSPKDMKNAFPPAGLTIAVPTVRIDAALNARFM
jgi:hypothetical protein